MPDEQGKLTAEEKTSAVAKISAKTPNLSCPVCRNNSFTMQDHVVAPIPFGGGYNLGGIAYPQIMLVCTTCTFVMSFSAVPSGLFPKTGETDAGK